MYWVMKSWPILIPFSHAKHFLARQRLFVSDKLWRFWHKLFFKTKFLFFLHKLLSNWFLKIYFFLKKKEKSWDRYFTLCNWEGWFWFNVNSFNVKSLKISWKSLKNFSLGTRLAPPWGSQLDSWCLPSKEGIKDYLCFFFGWARNKEIMFNLLLLSFASSIYWLG